MKSSHRFSVLRISIACFAVLICGGAARATIRYRISVAHPEQHTFHVTMAVPNSGAELVVAMPAWNALYQVRDFAYRIRNLQAESVSDEKPQPLVAEKMDKQTWHIFSTAHTALGEVRITYAINWDDPGPFNSQLNGEHAFLNFAEVLVYVPGRRKEETQVEFADAPGGWKRAVELESAAGTNAITAPSYDALADAPVELGRFQDFEFTENGARFRVVLHAKEWNRASFEDKLRKITRTETRMMGGPPFAEYTFFFHIGPYAEVGGGGMEHANCTSIAAGNEEQAISVAAHEFFHAWNVKRIRPQSLEPVDYTKEQFTRALWFAEGVTSTYGSFTLVRSGIWTTKQFYADLEQEISGLQSRPARAWQSVEESSLDTWFDKYDAYGAPGRSISYYNKGQLIGDILDLAIRDATDNHKSLDDVLRLLNEEFAKQGRFYNDSTDIRVAVEQVAGKTFEDFFRKYVSGTEEIPYQDFLSLAGLNLKESTQAALDLGFTPNRSPGTLWQVTQLNPGSKAEAAGLREGDEILLFNGEEPSRRPGAWLSHVAPGSTVKLRIRRQGEETELSYVPDSRETRIYSVEEAPHPTDKQRRIREGLLHGETQ